MTDQKETLAQAIASLAVDPDIAKEKTQKVQSKNIGTQPHKAPFRFIPLVVSGGSHQDTDNTKKLIEEIGGLNSLVKFTGLFYQKMFADQTMDKFINSHDDPHAQRFATFILYKFGVDDVWYKDCRKRERAQKPTPLAGGQQICVYDRSSAHAAAWYSAKREPSKVGRRFKLDDSRIWMRLHFWALRESGLLEQSPSFVDYYIRFIGHFVRVYERSAPCFARDSFRWSADPKNIAQYVKNGRKMVDLIDKPYAAHLKSIPDAEANDTVWPYNQK
jgi:hypothetical protein